MVEPSTCGGCDFKWPADASATAYIIVETKTIWFWQVNRYYREGWERPYGSPGGLRIKIERCIG